MSRSSARAGTLAVCLLLAIPTTAQASDSRDAARPATAPPAVNPVVPQRPAILPPLYASLAALQMLDLHSTVDALSSGAVEANRMMAPLGDHPAALFAVKAAATAGTIFISERLWRRNRLAAVLMMVGVNAAYAAVVVHNYSAARAAP